jgi:cell shape-determining protein MreC
MSVHFQGIVHLKGFTDAVEKAANRYEKGVYVTSTDSQNNFSTKIILNGADAVAFWAEQNVDAKLKERFKWYRPIRSFKAQLKELESLQEKMNPYLRNLTKFKALVQAYADKYPEKDIEGKAVIRKNLIPMKG